MKCRHCGEEMELKTLKDGNEYYICWNCKLKRPAETIRVKEPTFQEEKPKKKLSICLLISFFIGIAYSIYSIWYWFIDVPNAEGTAEQIGAALATALVYPHLTCLFLAVIFNAVGVFAKKRRFALTGAILYTVAMVLMPVYAPFVILETILSYVGFATMKNK